MNLTLTENKSLNKEGGIKILRDLNVQISVQADLEFFRPNLRLIKLRLGSCMNLSDISSDKNWLVKNRQRNTQSTYISGN